MSGLVRTLASETGSLMLGGKCGFVVAFRKGGGGVDLGIDGSKRGRELDIGDKKEGNKKIDNDFMIFFSYVYLTDRTCFYWYKDLKRKRTK